MFDNEKKNGDWEAPKMTTKKSSPHVLYTISLLYDKLNGIKCKSNMNYFYFDFF